MDAMSGVAGVTSLNETDSVLCRAVCASYT